MEDLINYKTFLDDIWKSDTYLKFKYINNKQIAIEANQSGLLFLGKLFMTMAESGITDDHYCMESYCGYIEKDSACVVISKVDKL